jgi:hypothetical protein
MGNNIIDAIHAELCATSLLNWKRKLNQGTLPSLGELADLIKANCAEPMPPWLVEHLCHRLRNPEKKKKGRPPSKPDIYKITFAKAMYWVVLKEFQSEAQSRSARKGGVAPPPHDRAAKYIQELYFEHMSSKAVLNLLSSRK